MAKKTIFISQQLQNQLDAVGLGQNNLSGDLCSLIQIALIHLKNTGDLAMGEVYSTIKVARAHPEYSEQDVVLYSNALVELFGRMPGNEV